LAVDFPLDRIGMLTITASDNLIDRKEACRRFNSLNRNILRSRYECAISVVERQSRGALHYHLILVTKSFLGTSADAQRIKDARFSYQFGDRAGSARLLRQCSPALRSEWAFWRRTARRYGFGRCSVEPVRTIAEALARYLAKYLKKHMAARIPLDKGLRLVRYIGFKDRRRFHCRFSWNSPGARRWRQAVAQFAMQTFCKDTVALRKKFGRRWCYKFRGILLGLAERRAQ
jgi:hypothetical protein